VVVQDLEASFKQSPDNLRHEQRCLPDAAGGESFCQPAKKLRGFWAIIKPP
jgi:hypothetical protein